ncbi:DNA gyrase/topoisomerase IV subunit A [Flammeovirga yaeyamensis]|uniref:DNA gyrase/topoisomerase IV subunit A n=2 Tax=Flammeovirga yaeyamensis TaxID=367791 RepID=A0AAX1NAJ1_9BACT|nr:DNA gyrase/topoisomerase IV subunit A [Flammeovirga yaeyamensis]MBB3699150.1 topoisomerase-4 subunit A [Flammeovirga yaeyamensis]NMF36583.1 DNA gyrase/topoisomerase IV subunit A [Flammeovirga yaeyamensis]QWG03461.1 DNA gyrase/topoisomerase IV subunit A [Flammeovirga yaeyamensis]
MENEQNSENNNVIHIDGMYQNWFLDYASYVILERAVPSIYDGLKPVQRRILHSMKELDDGRFNKVANIIGSTMQYHPHGDAAIGDAIVNLGQKELLIETQGNWGDIRTGDSAAAPRYIEARLSKFALEVVFNPKTTEWQLSYDGRKKEPINLPVKFPLLLSQGVEGIAVGLATKIMPHNVKELIKASIDVLKGKKVHLLPDFPTGGLADCSNYNSGLKGGKIRNRARIESPDNKTLLIKEIPYTCTTSSLIDSIIKANDQGKIKIKKVIDNTAKDVEIEIQLANGQSPDVTIAALYAFTDCEVSISPNACVIIDDKPVFIGVEDILKSDTDYTVKLLETELKIREGELQEKILFSSLEKIFIENRIYRDIEECETWEAVIETIDKGLTPFKPSFYREITEDDIVRLTEIKIKRISKYDTFKADELLKSLLEELEEVRHNLVHIIEYAIEYFQNLLKKYGKEHERLTELTTFDTILASKVAANNAKLYVNKKEGFIGFNLKKEEGVEEVMDCSDIDDIIVFRNTGEYVITKIGDKKFVGKNILHAEVYVKGDERKVYNAIYLDGATGITRVKRFQVPSFTRDKEYNVTKGSPKSKVTYFSSNPNGEAEVVGVSLSPNCSAKVKSFEYDFADLEIKGRGSQGNILTKYPVRRVTLKREGVSTLPAIDLWYDESVGLLNKDENGKYLGKFKDEDRIIIFYEDGEYELTNFEITNRYDAKKVVLIEKFLPYKAISAVHYDTNNRQYYIKRFHIETSTMNKRFKFINEANASRLLLVTTQMSPLVELTYTNGRKREKYQVNLKEFVEVKGWKALGNRIPHDKVTDAKLLSKDDAVDTTESTTKKEDDSSNDDHNDGHDSLRLF